MRKVNIKNLFNKLLLVGLCIFTFTSCGYKPSSTYAKKELDGKVYIDLYIDLVEPKTAVLLKDNINEILIQKLNTKLVYDKKSADILMNLKIDSIKMQELQYDKDGYNKLYRAIVNIKVDYKKLAQKEKKSLTLIGEYNFSIDDGTTITDTKRYEAIKEASFNAIEDFLPKLAALSFKN